MFFNGKSIFLQGENWLTGRSFTFHVPLIKTDHENKNQLYKALLAYTWNYVSLENFVGEVGDLRYDFNVDSVEKFFDTICKNKHYVLSLEDFHNDFLHKTFSFDEFYEITLLKSVDLGKKSIQIKKFYLEYYEFK